MFHSLISEEAIVVVVVVVVVDVFVVVAVATNVALAAAVAIVVLDVVIIVVTCLRHAHILHEANLLICTMSQNLHGYGLSGQCLSSSLT